VSDANKFKSKFALGEEWTHSPKFNPGIQSLEVLWQAEREISLGGEVCFLINWLHLGDYCVYMVALGLKSGVHRPKRRQLQEPKKKAIF
jgi:hypothetical protein